MELNKIETKTVMSGNLESSYDILRKKTGKKKKKSLMKAIRKILENRK